MRRARPGLRSTTRRGRIEPCGSPWTAPRSTVSRLVVEEIGARVAFRAELRDEFECVGDDNLYGITVTFSRPMPANDIVPTVVRRTWP